MGKSFRVIGILEKKGSFLGNSLDSIVLIPHTTALDVFPEARRQMVFMVQAESPKQVPEAKAQITTALRRGITLDRANPTISAFKARTRCWNSSTKSAASPRPRWPASSASRCLVGGIGIMNVMLVSVTERTREIGLRKAVGARRLDILAQFLTEAVVLSTSGGLIGIGLGYGITYMVGLHPSMVDIGVPFWSVLLGVGFSVGVGVVFGLLPAFKAAILQPIDALRYE